MAGKGGGAWKVAYADFVTAMMAFFLVMWITGQSKQIKQAIAHYFNYASSTERTNEDSSPPVGPGAPGPGGPEVGSVLPSGKLDPLTARPIELGMRLPGRTVTAPKPPEGELDGKALKPRLLALHDGQRPTLGTVIPFDEPSAELSGTGKDRLRRFAPLVAGKRSKIEVRGHATRRPMPPESRFADPWQLAYGRCQAVLKALEELGIESERIRLSQAGPHEPHTLAADPASQAENARVEVYVLAERTEDLVGTAAERAARFAAP